MNSIKSTVKKLVKQGKLIEATLPVKKNKEYGEETYYLPDAELEKFIKNYPEYERVGTDYFEIEGKKVWLPYYMTKGFFTSKADQLMPLKITPVFP